MQGFLISWLLWFGAWGAVFLPVLSHCGYPLLGLEYLAALGLTCTLALLSSLADRVSSFSVFLLLPLSFANASLYFGHLIMYNLATIMVALALCAAFILLCIRHSRIALRLSGIVGLSQLGIALLGTPSAAYEQEWQRASSGPLISAPPVIHILLDEHTGLASIPSSPQNETLRRRILDTFLSRGFLVFTHAYSEYEHTNLSIAYLHNPQTPPESNLELVEGTNVFFTIKHSWLFSTVARSRNIDVTGITHIDLSPALKESKAHVRLRNCDSQVAISSALSQVMVSSGNRLYLALWRSLYWFRNGKRANSLTLWAHELLKIPLLRNNAPSSEPVSIPGIMELQSFKNRLSKQCSPSWYYFGHFLATHYPYCFDEQGTLRAPQNWLGRYHTIPPHPANMEALTPVFEAHLRQALYSDNLIADLADTLDHNLSRDGHAMIVHSDHGSRIVLSKDSSELSSSQRDRLMRNSFLAIRIPGLTGGVVERPIAMERVINQLVKNNFKDLNLNTIPLTPGNPFAAP